MDLRWALLLKLFKCLSIAAKFINTKYLIKPKKIWAPQTYYGLKVWRCVYFIIMLIIYGQTCRPCTITQCYALELYSLGLVDVDQRPNFGSCEWDMLVTDDDLQFLGEQNQSNWKKWNRCFQNILSQSKGLHDQCIKGKRTSRMIQTCLPTLSGGGHRASSSFVISLSSMILFSSSITLLWTYA